MAAQGGYIPRSFRQIPHVEKPHVTDYSRGGQVSGGGGNPLRAAAEPTDTLGQGDYIAPPTHVGGLLGLAIDPQRDKDYEQRVNARDTARQEKVQAGVDAYQQALEKTGDPKQALASVFHTDSGGHVHFADPPTFNAILKMHEAASSNAGTGQFQQVDLGHGLIGIADPNGKYSVHNTHDPNATSHTTTGYRTDDQGRQIPIVINKDSGTARDVTSESGDPLMRKDAPAQKQLPTTKAQTDQLQDIQTVLDQVQKMRNTVGASGSLGYGKIERGLAMHTGLGGKQAEAYNEAYNEMAPALSRLQRVPGSQSQMIAKLALDRLPKPGNAEAFNIDQVLPGIEYGMRQQVANLYQTYKLENRVGGREMAKGIAQTYDAHPDQIKELEQAKLALRSNPGQMPTELVEPLMNEAKAGRLGYDDWTRVMRQGIQRGLVDPKDFDKLAAASPDLSQISPEEHVAPQFARPWAPPQAQPTQIPAGAPPGPAGTRNIPPGDNSAAQPSPQQTSFPAGGPGQNTATSGAPPTQVQPPAIPPATDQQQAQAPQQVQQIEADQAPPEQPGQGGFFSQLMQHLPTALQTMFGGQQQPQPGQ